MLLSSRVLLAAGCVVVASGWVGCAPAERVEIGLDPSQRVIDARADEQVKRMSDYLAGLQRFRFEADVAYDDFLVESQMVQYSKRAVVEVQRPNRARGTVDGDVEQKKYWYDGQQVVILDAAKNVYSAIDAPDTIDAMLVTLADEYNLILALSELIESNPYDALMNNVVTARHVGMHRVGGAVCHHLAFEQTALDWQIWIDQGEHPFPRKMLISYKAMDGTPQYQATFTRWDASPALNDQDFTVSLPKDAVQVELTPPQPIVQAAEEK